MGRLFLFVIIAIIAGVIALAKNAIGNVSGNDELKDASVRSEAKKVMDKTARGINWMEEQWEESKKSVNSSNKKIEHDD